MSAPTETPVTPAVPVVEFQAPAAAAPAPASGAPTAEAPGVPDESGLDDHAKRVIEAIRRDFKDERTRRQAAEEALGKAPNEIAQSIGKALGLIKDDEPADPVKLTEQLTATAAEAKQAKVELSVFHAASGIGADAARLLDSKSFMAKVSAVDPSDRTAITAAITEAVAGDPTLVKTRMPAPNPALGSSGGGGAPDIDAQIAEATKSGNYQLAISLKRQAQALRKSST